MNVLKINCLHWDYTAFVHIKMGRTDVFKMLNLPIRWHRISFHLFSSLVSFIQVLISFKEFYFFLPFCIPFISLSSLIALDRTFQQNGEKQWWEGHLFLAPDLSGKALNLSPFHMMLAVGFRNQVCFLKTISTIFFNTKFFYANNIPLHFVQINTMLVYAFKKHGEMFQYIMKSYEDYTNETKK